MADALDEIYEVMLHDDNMLPRVFCSKGAQLFPVGRAHGDIVQYHCGQCPAVVEKTRMELITYHGPGAILTVSCQGEEDELEGSVGQDS